jgi:hypothetical protein
MARTRAGLGWKTRSSASFQKDIEAIIAFVEILRLCLGHRMRNGEFAPLTKTGTNGSRTNATGCVPLAMPVLFWQAH